MVNINFVPDDYIQGNESRRTNLMCVVLFVVVMAGLGGSFVTIKMRQRAFGAEEKLVNSKMSRLQETIQKFEELQIKRKEMMKTALVTAQLLEPVPRSVLLASLTNNLPPGVSLLELNLVQSKPRRTATSARANAYQAARAENQKGANQAVSPERFLETSIDIGGIAPSDLQVASYLERLSTSSLLKNVALVESKEFNIDDTSFRKFKLTAMLKQDMHLTKKDVDRIRAGTDGAVGSF
jgi:Tfp pilus assembly protein PilN